ncbi:MAG: penicillin acylase family protein [Pseudomonadota bacterium]
MLRRLFHVFLTVFAVLLVLLLLALPVTYWWLSQEEPTLSGDLALGDLIDAPVRVVWDEHAIPHIFAQSMDDAYVALGYLHAQDRLFQMEMQRRAGQGRLSEVLGRLPFQVDKMMRTLDFYTLAQDDFEQGSAPAKRAVERYADGVNHYLRHHDDPPPVEFRLIGLLNGSLTPHQPEPWQPADSVVWGKLMGLQLSGNLFDETQRALLAKHLSADEIRNLTVFDQQDGAITLSSLDHLRQATFDWAGLNNAVPRLGPDRASNVWAVDGRHTASGKPILANDPHLGLSAPILWYLVRIVTPELTITGATAPGVPFHLLGHNDQAAWGLTTTGGDVVDLYLEQQHPGDPDRYLTETGDAAFDTRDATIAIGQKGETETITVRTTRHGLVISDLDDRLAPLAEDGQFVTMRTTLTEPNDSSWEAIYHLNRATDWPAFTDAMSLFKSGQQNAVFADQSGDIGLFSPALIPVRAQGDGSVPLDGAKTPPNWERWLTLDELPQQLNPPDGMIVNANNRLTAPDYPHHITFDWEADYRARRIEEWLATNPIDQATSHAQLMVDPVSMAARDLLPILTSLEGETSLQRAVIDQLNQWDGTMDRDRPEPLIFTAWLHEMTPALLVDELGEHVQLMPRSNPELVARIIGNGQAWCDDIDSQPFTETCEQAAINGLSRALAVLIDRYGDGWQQWRWGAAHKAPLAPPTAHP